MWGLDVVMGRASGKHTAYFGKASGGMNSVLHIQLTNWVQESQKYAELYYQVQIAGICIIPKTHTQTHTHLSVLLSLPQPSIDRTINAAH